MPDKTGRMTVQERAFVRHFADTGDPVYAAEKAGYAQPERRALEKLHSPVIAAATRRQQIERLNNELLPLAVDTLQSILTDAEATDRARLAATAQVLKATIGANVEASQGKEPHEMSSDELQQRIADLRREAAERAKPIIDVEPAESGVFD